MHPRGALTEKTVTFGETTFEIGRALPIEAFELFESLRPGLGSISDAVKSAFQADRDGVDRDANALGTAIAILGQLPTETVKTAMTGLFRHVTYVRPGNVQSPTVVARDLAGAMRDMSVLDIYELIVRAFAVNFMRSFDDLQSLWSQATAADESPPET